MKGALDVYIVYSKRGWIYNAFKNKPTAFPSSFTSILKCCWFLDDWACYQLYPVYAKPDKLNVEMVLSYELVTMKSDGD